MPIPESKRRNNDIYNAKCDRISARPIKPSAPLPRPPGRAYRRMCCKPAKNA